VLLVIVGLILGRTVPVRPDVGVRFTVPAAGLKLAVNPPVTPGPGCWRPVRNDPALAW
jgi:hypothetical protein